MRGWTAILALSFAGCLGHATTPVEHGCAADANQADGDAYILLVPHDAPTEARPAGQRADYLVRVLPGQSLAVEARWDAAEGLASLLLDNRSVTQPAAASSYAWSGPASPGVHILELEGTPIAVNVRLTLAVAALCPPTA